MVVRSMESADDVLLPCVSWVSKADSVAATGARPMFFDVDVRTLNPSVAASRMQGRWDTADQQCHLSDGLERARQAPRDLPKPQGHSPHRPGGTGTLGDADPAGECELVLGTLDGVFANAGVGMTGTASIAWADPVSETSRKRQ